MLLRRSPTALNEYVTPKRSNTDGAQLANDAIVGNYLSDHSRPHRSAMLFPTRMQVNGNDQLVARRFPGTGCHDGFVGFIARFVVPISEHFKPKAAQVFVEDLVPFSEQFSESSSMSSARSKNNSESDALRRRARAPDKPAAISAI